MEVRQQATDIPHLATESLPEIRQCFERRADDARIDDPLRNPAAGLEMHGEGDAGLAWGSGIELPGALADTPGGARASANLYSLIETAKANGLEPHVYLTHIAARLPEAHTVEDYEALLPHRVHPALLPSTVNDALR